MSLSLQAVIFDLDGTLIDTEPAAAKAIDLCFSEWGIQLEADDSHFVTGRTWQSAFDFLFAKYKIPVPDTHAAKLVLERYRQSLQEGRFAVVPGSVDAVRSLADDGIPLSIVSGSHRSEILWAIRHLKIEKCFQFVLGAEDYPRSKPAPDGYLAAMSRHSVDANRCLIFEDSQAGIASALAAGSWVVAITGTNHFGQDVSKAHCHIENLLPVTAKWARETADRFSRQS